ncbi:hypothetical protein BDB01DRAFT_838411 [Pilobolus umbonatus]|nr:hypothetical protein BDB01DRAFT_838411 [Pilobolus umbonatus]
MCLEFHRVPGLIEEGLLLENKGMHKYHKFENGSTCVPVLLYLFLSPIAAVYVVLSNDCFFERKHDMKKRFFFLIFEHAIIIAIQFRLARYLCSVIPFQSNLISIVPNGSVCGYLEIDIYCAGNVNELCKSF